MKQSYHVRFLGGADADLDELTALYEAARPGFGDRFAKRVNDFLRAIESQPRMYARVRRRSDKREIRIGALRQFPVVIEYVIDGDQVIIQYLKHGRRDYNRFMRSRRR